MTSQVKGYRMCYYCDAHFYCYANDASKVEHHIYLQMLFPLALFALLGHPCLSVWNLFFVFLGLFFVVVVLFHFVVAIQNCVKI